MKEIKTPFGLIKPNVILFPIYYLIFVFGFVYILPFGIYKKLFIGEDSFIEWLQFILYFSASFISFLIVILDINKKKFKLNTIYWFLLAIFCFYVAGEEISWAERITDIGSNAIREINMQGETNLHNLKGFNDYLHFSFIFAGIFFGWLGWKFFPKIEALPSKKYSLFFLLVAAHYAFADLSWITLGIRYPSLIISETMEFLMALGLFWHCLTNIKLRFKYIKRLV
tara:strand:- start:447 stop:1124 length:678 start_codon:yes stop_codon:yes gene_type:complete